MHAVVAMLPPFDGPAHDAIAVALCYAPLLSACLLYRDALNPSSGPPLPAAVLRAALCSYSTVMPSNPPVAIRYLPHAVLPFALP